eukprot:3987876-Amphidinium_carterae.1
MLIVSQAPQSPVKWHAVCLDESNMCWFRFRHLRYTLWTVAYILTLDGAKALLEAQPQNSHHETIEVLLKTRRLTERFHTI